MYPTSRADLFRHAAAIASLMGTAYDRLGPFAVFSELHEGGAVIESECLPQTEDRPGRYVGCGMARLNILKGFFRSVNAGGPGADALVPRDPLY